MQLVAIANYLAHLDFTWFDQIDAYAVLSDKWINTYRALFFLSFFSLILPWSWIHCNHSLKCRYWYCYRVSTNAFYYQYQMYHPSDIGRYYKVNIVWVPQNPIQYCRYVSELADFKTIILTLSTYVRDELYEQCFKFRMLA